jgi:hypothetical protein
MTEHSKKTKVHQKIAIEKKYFPRIFDSKININYKDISFLASSSSTNNITRLKKTTNKVKFD